MPKKNVVSRGCVSVAAAAAEDLSAKFTINASHVSARATAQFLHDEFWVRRALWTRNGPCGAKVRGYVCAKNRERSDSGLM